MPKKKTNLCNKILSIVGFYGTASATAQLFNLLWVGGGVVVGVISRFVSQLPIYLCVILGIIASLFVLVIIRFIAYRNKRGNKPNVEFYDSRQELNEFRHGLQNEIDSPDVKSVWLSTWWGNYFTQFPQLLTDSRTKIKILVFLSPEYDQLKQFCTFAGQEYPSCQTTIIQNTERAIANNISVWWVIEPLDGMVITNPNKKDGYGWIRMETRPHMMNGENINYVIYENERGKLYYRLLSYFESITNGEPLTKQMVEETKKRIYGKGQHNG